MAYKLELPEGSKIHLVVHVSQLKKMVTSDIPVSTTLPPTNTLLQAEHQPASILEHKLIKVQGALQPRVLVQWSELPPSLATWEEPQDLQLRFPMAPAWGQAGPQEGANVTADKRALTRQQERDLTVPASA